MKQLLSMSVTALTNQTTWKKRLLSMSVTALTNQTTRKKRLLSHVSHSLDKPNSLESSSVGSSSNLTGRKPKRIESLFEDDADDDTLFVTAVLPKQTTKTLSEKVNSSQQSEAEENKRRGSNISNLTAKDVASSQRRKLG